MRMNKSSVYQIVGYKNRGKTNLVCRLVDVLVAQGNKVATIKHDGHEFEFDRKGSDTWLHRHSGACWTAITASNGTAIVHNEALQLEQLIQQAPSDSIILVEGFKLELYPKLVLVRWEEDLTLLEQLQGITAVVLWPEIWESQELRARIESIAPLNVFELDDTEWIAQHIEKLQQSICS